MNPETAVMLTLMMAMLGTQAYLIREVSSIKHVVGSCKYCQRSKIEAKMMVDLELPGDN